MSPAVEIEDRWHGHTCRKRRYVRKQAAAVAKRQAKQLGEPIGHYHCEQCHAWHTGHPPGWKAREERRRRRMLGG